MKAKYQRRPGGFTLVELLVVIVIIAALAGLSAPVILKQRKAADRTEALNNVRQIGLSLFEFDAEYGSFPDNNTAEDVKEATGTVLTFHPVMLAEFGIWLFCATSTPAPSGDHVSSHAVSLDLSRTSPS